MVRQELLRSNAEKMVEKEGSARSLGFSQVHRLWRLAISVLVSFMA